MRLRVLAVVALVVGMLHLGAQDNTIDDRRKTGTGSSSHAAIRTDSQHEFEVIRWNKLLKDMKAELNVDDPEIDRVIDGQRKSILSIVCLGKTDKKFGLMGLHWDQRKTRKIELFEVSKNRYLVVKVEEYVETKAPYGDWYLEEELSRRFVISPSVGQLIIGKFP